MMNPEYDRFVKAINAYIGMYYDSNMARACLLGKLQGFLDFNLTEEQMARLAKSIEEDVIDFNALKVAA